jgi:hypothetical protein
VVLNDPDSRERGQRGRVCGQVKGHAETVIYRARLFCS